MIVFKKNACLNNTDRNKIPVKDHTMFFIVSCTLSQNVCYLLFFAFRSGPGQLVLYKIPGVTIIH